MRCPNPKPRLWEGRNQEEDIEIFGFEETKYERKWMRAHDKSNLTAARVRGRTGTLLRKPGHSGEVAPRNVNSRFADLAIQIDNHELNPGRCPGPTRIVHIWRLTRIILNLWLVSNKKLDSNSFHTIFFHPRSVTFLFVQAWTNQAILLL